MRKYSLQILVVIMSVSLIGIIIVQAFWIRNAIQVKETEYKKNIREAIASIIKKVERKQAVMFISENLENISMQRIGSSSMFDKGFVEYFHGDSVFHIIADSAGYITSNELKMNIISSERKSQNNERFKVIKETIQKKEPENNALIISSLKYTGNESNVIVVRDSIIADSNIFTTKEIYLNVFDDMLHEYETRYNPIEDRLEIERLDTLIKTEILEKGLDKNYEYAIIDTRQDTIYKSSEGFKDEFTLKSFKASLFPDALVDEPIYLYLYLPGMNNVIYKSISYMLLGSIVFTLVIIVIFFVTARITFRQKKLSEIKSDFINNMTHEFKTPIATISLAADSIINPKIISNEEKINDYIKIIKEENRRMNNQVESVLQISLLEKEKFKVNLQEFDLHELIQRAVKNIELKIKEKSGVLKMSLEAENPFALVDETHFLNIIHNLLDNAIKYSPEILFITLKTRNQNGKIHISVEDQGIGIKNDELVRIFDKFYRVPTGNVHNVKGFGLGLSYVKAIVKEFNGTIHAISEFGNLPAGKAGGSKFEINIPVIPVHNGK